MKRDSEELISLAEAAGLESIATCDNFSGYPSGIETAIIGFKTFSEAEEFAEEHQLKVQKFQIEDGHQFWARAGAAYEPIKITEDLFGDNYMVFPKEAVKTFYEEEVRPRLEDFTNFEDLEEFIKDQREIYDELDYMSDKRVVITHCGRYYDTTDEITMSFYFDRTRTVIGVA